MQCGESGSGSELRTGGRRRCHVLRFACSKSTRFSNSTLVSYLSKRAHSATMSSLLGFCLRSDPYGNIPLSIAFETSSAPPLLPPLPFPFSPPFFFLPFSSSPPPCAPPSPLTPLLCVFLSGSAFGANSVGENCSKLVSGRNQEEARQNRKLNDVDHQHSPQNERITESGGLTAANCTHCSDGFVLDLLVAASEQGWNRTYTNVNRFELLQPTTYVRYVR